MATGTPSARPPARLTSRMWDRLSINIPGLIMGRLALISYWILHSTPEPASAPAERPMSHIPDYIMRDFSLRNFDAQGGLRQSITGREARHYPDTRLLEIDDAQLHATSEQGIKFQGQAQRIITNDAQSEHTLTGQVVLIREAGVDQQGKSLPKLMFEGEHLTIWPNEDRVHSQRPLVLTRGPDRIRAEQMVYSDQSQIAELSGRVQATIVPQKQKP